MNKNLLVESIDITPDQSLLPKLGQTGYSIPDAISELVDNSIDARISGNIVRVDIEIDADHISVKDNGAGMAKDVAKKSVVLGQSSKKLGELGQFGLGLKTACTSMGKDFSVLTSPIGLSESYLINFEEENFISNKKWELPFNIIKDDSNAHGTELVITKLRFKFQRGLIPRVRDDIVERFAPFIFNKEVEIYVNNEKIAPKLPELVEGSRKEISIDLSDGNKVTGWAGILINGSQIKSGFNMYRNKRLIRAHEKLGYNYHPSKMWIVGDINLDSIPVTHNKREFITTDPMYVEFIEKFKVIIAPLLKEAQKKQNKDAIKDIPEEQRETLKDDVMKAVNFVNDFKDLSSIGSDLNKRSSDDGELSEKEKREKPVTEVVIDNRPAVISPNSEESQKRGRKPQKIQPQKVRFITIAGEKFRFDYEWGDLEDPIAKVADVDKYKKRINIILNSNFSIVTVVKDLYIYVALMVSEGIAEAFLREGKGDLAKVIQLRDKTVEQLGKILAEDLDSELIKRGQDDMQLINILEANIDDRDQLPIDTRELDVLYLRFGVGSRPMTLQQIANKYKLTRERVRQIVEKNREKLLHFYEE